MANSGKLLSWRPVDVAELEKSADDAVRSLNNVLVVAGPGAGKTELLAQRACYLLQTGLCANPRRILAISFKRDAARNLRERVARRCGPQLAARFDSYTFDSFSKGLVDRFLLAIPEAFRPRPEYRVLDGRAFNQDKILDFMREVPQALCSLNANARNALSGSRLYWQGLLRLLPKTDWPAPRHDEDIAGAALWNHLLHSGPKSAVSFPMLALVAELLLRANPLILSALRSSYQFVFLDEFQDTSKVHYALTRTAFKGTSAVLTAVGDDKQRIMVWAGALRDVFDLYVNDFGAEKISLTRNYRSCSKLVAIQAVIAKALDPASIDAVCAHKDESDGSCRALEFKDEREEALYIADLVAGWINNGFPPREICVLTRMRPADYTAVLQEELGRLGVRSRVENELQDLLAEPVTEALLDLLKISCRDNEGQAWGRTVALLRELAGEHDERRVRKLADGLLSSTQNLHKKMADTDPSKDGVKELLEEAMSHLGESSFRALYPQYAQTSWFEKQVDDLAAVLASSLKGNDWPSAIDEVEGMSSVPIMTTHKSKGLEYRSIVFIGLEDGAHFNYQKNPSEEQCGFFVALSRAKENVVFTFSAARPRYSGQARRPQSKDEISDIYDLLEQAGVELEVID